MDPEWRLIATVKPTAEKAVIITDSKNMSENLLYLLYKFTQYERIKNMEKSITCAWTNNQKRILAEHIQPLTKILKNVEEKELKNNMDRKFVHNIAAYRERLLKKIGSFADDCGNIEDLVKEPVSRIDAIIIYIQMLRSIIVIVD